MSDAYGACVLPILAQDQSVKRYCGRRPVIRVRVDGKAVELCEGHARLVRDRGWEGAIEEESYGGRD